MFTNREGLQEHCSRSLRGGTRAPRELGAALRQLLSPLSRQPPSFGLAQPTEGVQENRSRSSLGGTQAAWDVGGVVQLQQPAASLRAAFERPSPAVVGVLESGSEDHDTNHYLDHTSDIHVEHTGMQMARRVIDVY